MRRRFVCAALFVATLALSYCSDAPCPAGTVDEGEHCAPQMTNASSVAGAGSAAVSGSPAGAGSDTSDNASGWPSAAGNTAMSTAASGAAGAPATGNRLTLADGEPCATAAECTSGFCKNVVNGKGICCGAMGDCCKTAGDCPAKYTSPPRCDRVSECKGSRTEAVCTASMCTLSSLDANEACDGMLGSTCGFYEDLVCMAGRSNICRTSCATNAECDANAVCMNRVCQGKSENGGACASNAECTSGNCTNSVCCSAGGECCKTADDCKLGLDAQCDLDPPSCQGTMRQATCASSMCRYSASRIDDDRGCTGNGDACGSFKAIQCNGTSQQFGQCKQICETNDDCDPGAQCLTNRGALRCLAYSD